MATVADDLAEPDETRPAKRVRLEAPLDVTEDVEEEMIDDEDLYGTDIIDEPAQLEPQAGAGADNVRELPNSITMVDSEEQAQHTNGFATPRIDSGEATDTEDLYGESTVTGETIDDLPAEAVDGGGIDDFVAPPMHVPGEDSVEVAMMEETTQTEAKPPAVNGEPYSVPAAVEQQEKEELPQTDDEVRELVDIGHIAPPRERQENEDEDGGVALPADESDILGDLKSALESDGRDAAAHSGEPAATSKPKDDPAFLEAAAAQKGDEAAEWQYDSSDAESSSDSSDSSDSDSESGSEGGYEMLDAATAAKILMSGDGDEDGGKEKDHSKGGPRTANEVEDEVVPKPDVTVTEDMKITLLGKVERTVENLVLIQGATPGEYQVVESGSVLCNAAREVIGAVYETLGKVQSPMYSVAFTNAQEIESIGLTWGTKVYYVDQHSTFVFTQPLKNMKGTDASNIHDEEVGEDEIEFSDDEKEAEYKRQKKAAKRGGRGGLTRTEFNSDRDGMRTFGAPGHDSGHTFVGGGASDAPQTTYGGGMSYDDGDDAKDDFYQPLKRPDNLSELMAGAPPPPAQSRGGFDRGRGRGRGRGDRGRGDRGRGRGGFQQRGGHQQSPPRDAAARGGHGQQNGQHGQRGGFDQAGGHRGNAHSFPDRHNKPGGKHKGRGGGGGQHSLPAKPPHAQSPTPAQASPQQQEYQPQPPVNPINVYPQQPQQQPSYQFNGYTFQYGNPPPPPPAVQTSYPQPPQPPQQQYYAQQQQQPYYAPQQQHSPSAPQFPQGAYVNPAFWAQQQQQQGYNGWAGQQQPQQQYVQQSYAAPQGQGQAQGNLAEVLRMLGGQGGQGAR